MVGLLVFYSEIESLESVKKRTNEDVNYLLNFNKSLKLVGYFNEKEEVETNLIKNNLNDLNGLVLFVSSGGTEEVIYEVIEEASLPSLLCCFPRKNSLAASLEIYSVAKNNFPIKMQYSEIIEETGKEINQFEKTCYTISRLNKAKIGIIGEPSDWLLTSKGFNGFGFFETIYQKISTDLLNEEIAKIDTLHAKSMASDYSSQFGSVRVTDEELVDSFRVYLGLKKVVADKNLDVLTVRCFDLLDLDYTSCLGLSIFNDENFVAGCEADLQATFTMMLASYITNEPCWMANPSMIDKKDNSLILAHCTVPARMLSDLSESVLVSHMESNKSTAISGPLNKGEVTILRIGKDYDQLLATTGRIIETDMKDKDLCRTQARITLDGNISEWMENSLGNHQVLVYGDITDQLEEFCQLTNVKPLIINSQYSGSLF